MQRRGGAEDTEKDSAHSPSGEGRRRMEPANASIRVIRGIRGSSHRRFQAKSSNSRSCSAECRVPKGAACFQPPSPIARSRFDRLKALSVPKGAQSQPHAATPPGRNARGAPAQPILGGWKHAAPLTALHAAAGRENRVVARFEKTPPFRNMTCPFTGEGWPEACSHVPSCPRSTTRAARALHPSGRSSARLG